MQDYSFDTKTMAIWDQADALKRVMGKEDILKIVVSAFLQDVPIYLDNLNDAFASQNSEEVIKNTHTLKGVAGNVSAFAMAEIAKNIEQAYKDNATAEELARNIEILNDVVTKSCEVLSNWQENQISG